MAIDTAEKRFSMMGLGNPVLKLAVPTGSVNAAKRAVFLDLYSGIALGGAPTGSWLTRNYWWDNK
jgi:hypothetical protein